MDVWLDGRFAMSLRVSYGRNSHKGLNVRRGHFSVVMVTSTSSTLDIFELSPVGT